MMTQTRNEGTTYESIEFKTTVKTLSIESKDRYDAVEICFEEYGDSMSFYLRQEHIRVLIDFLQKQLV